MTKEQISDVATAARGAAIGQAVQYGNRCVFAIVVVGLDVGAPMAVQTNAVDASPDQVIRILQNGIHALQESKKGGGGKTGGGLILLSVLALVFGILAAVVGGCGSVSTEADHVAADATTPSDASLSGASGAGAGGGQGGSGSGGTSGGAGVAGGNDAGAAGAAGAAGGAAGGGQAAGASGSAGMTGGAGGAGLTGAAGAGGCAPKGALCYACPAPAPTCGVPGRAYLCCDKGGAPSCDPGWCAP